MSDRLFILKNSYLLFCFSVLVSLLGVARADQSPVGPSAGGDRSRIDGVPVEAVEEFPNLRRHEVSLDAGIYPFNPYYEGLSIGGGYAYHFSSSLGWEVVHAQQFFSVQNGLTAELADKYQVNPQTIETVKYAFSSDFLYVFANGKFAFASDYIRYFRAALLVGPGLVNTNERSEAAANFGARFEFFTGDTFAWRFEARDSLCVGGIGNVLTMSLGTGIRF